MTLRVGIVGAGIHGTRYLRHLEHDAPGLAPAALCRRDPRAGQELGAGLGIPWFASYEDLIDHPGVDSVIVATPPASHFAIAARALAAGKPVLVEKPMTGTLAEARRLATLAAAPGAPLLMVAQTLRWNPVLQRVRSLWPRLGRVHLVRFAQRLAPTALTWQREPAETVGGSVLLTGVHGFDLVRWLTGREFRRMDSRQRQVLNPVVEDLFLARAELDDGCWVSCEVSKFTQSQACWLEAVGEAGQIWADYLDGGLVLRCGREEFRETVDARSPTLPSVLDAWRDAIERERPAPVTAVDGLRTLEVADACYRSQRRGGAVGLEL
ncbi:MAG TPA: Gfo/Idh/MocA family oxidoreductase [Candidatus Krumholzibacteria bacterium]|nr:Gfo/Idh/MocA family oxidoreductase [Candidatus Krumholzibacteria bacterium]HPD71133.1 Gfo/Idh/MocA family oxidoreductase [Candidatus Krumholzibacteria bacterium]HRY39167.1 Gfo/Idh/MocA family oxidoreductase [Candidatus Krumholzibacteria bacterium]